MAASPAPTRPCLLPDGLRRRLDREPVVWLGTAGADGAPHILPLWFTFDGEAITVFSKPHALKVRNVRRDPRVSLAIGSPYGDLDVALLEGHASLADVPQPDTRHRLGLERYRDSMDRLGVSIDQFLSTYSQPIRIVPTRVLDWGQPGWAV